MTLRADTSATEALVVGPAEALALGAGVVGGKAFALAEMAAKGFPVPPFVVLLPDALEGGAIRPQAAAALAQAVTTEVPAERYAVRSSGRLEDGTEDSHAGQFLTVLDVAADGIAAAAIRVFESGRSATVAAYRAARGQVGVELPAIVVQAMVPARVAGVAFAADPVSGRRDRVVVTAVPGLGESLVSGAVDGETWELLRPIFEPVRRPRRGAVLVADEASAVARLCAAVSDARAAPQDIEWAFAPGQAAPILLQARPITTALLPAAAPETVLRVFDNSNIVESYPGLVSPLTFSFAVAAYARVYKTFLRLIGVSEAVVAEHAAELANMLSRIDGRIYYNLGNWYRLLSLLPFFSSNAAHMEAMMGVTEPLPAEATAGAAAPPGLAAKLRLVAGLGMAAFRLPRTRTAFLRRVADAIPAKPDPSALAALPLSRLAVEYRRVEAALLDRWDAPLVNDFLCMMSFGASRRLIERWGGAEGLALHNDVMIGQGDIISAEPARLLRAAGAAARDLPGAVAALAAGDRARVLALPRLGELLQTYLDRFGDRRIGELKLEQPTLDEDPTALFQAVVAAAGTVGAPIAPRDPARALAMLFPRQPIRRMVIGVLLAYAKARVRDRENLRFERTRIFGHARRLFVAIGRALTASGLLARADDVFLLTVDEVLGVAEGSAVTVDIKALSALRRHEQEAWAALPDPPSRVLMRGAVIDRSARLSDEEMTPEPRDHADERRGTACGGGIATGRVRVIRDPHTEQLGPGEVLVARHTDPGWISHFAHAVAVVTERGSVLSHSAIVSRELGIPCVVAVDCACSWLQSGETVTVDGSTGAVHRHRD